MIFQTFRWCAVKLDETVNNLSTFFPIINENRISHGDDNARIIHTGTGHVDLK